VATETASLYFRNGMLRKVKSHPAILRKTVKILRAILEFVTSND
jgi:hypothetical protein